jgi:Domain of unknown function (DUF4326)
MEQAWNELVDISIATTDVQWAIARWWLGLGTSRAKSDLLKRANTELGTDFKVAAIKKAAIVVSKLDFAGVEGGNVGLSSWVKILAGVTDAETIVRLADMAKGGATIAECRATLPIVSKSKIIVSKCERYEAFLLWAKFVKEPGAWVCALQLAVAYEEAVSYFVKPQPEKPWDEPSFDLKPPKVATVEPGYQFELLQEVVILPQSTDKPDSIPDSAWSGFTSYERTQAIALLRGKTVVCAMHSLFSPETAFTEWAKSLGLFVKIDRSNKVYGNPFKVGADKDGTLPQVIEKYRARVQADPALLNRIPEELRGKALGCWCKKGEGKAQCHGDVLAEIANKGAL